MCKYQYRDKTVCQEPEEPGSDYCILHMPFPSDKDSDEWKRIDLLKNNRFNQKIETEDYNFEGVIIGNLEFNGVFIKDVNFFMTTFMGDVRFVSASFSGLARFDSASFLGDAWFSGATFLRDVEFNFVTFSGMVRFSRANFSGDAWFSDTTFSRETMFSGVTFSKETWFSRVTFSGIATFSSTTFLGDSVFYELNVKSKFSLEKSNNHQSLNVSFNECEDGAIILMNYINIKGSCEIGFLELKDQSSFEMIGTIIEEKLSFSPVEDNKKIIIGGKMNLNNLEAKTIEVFISHPLPAA